MQKICINSSVYSKVILYLLLFSTHGSCVSQNTKDIKENDSVEFTLSEIETLWKSDKCNKNENRLSIVSYVLNTNLIEGFSDSLVTNIFGKPFYVSENPKFYDSWYYASDFLKVETRSDIYECGLVIGLFKINVQDDKVVSFGYDVISSTEYLELMNQRYYYPVE